jgi:hypothetical protein
MSSGGKSKRRRLDEVLDGAILVAKGTKEVGGSVPILAPLKVSMGSVITLMENLKVGPLRSVRAIV